MKGMKKEQVRKHPSAVARDEFFASDGGKGLLEPLAGPGSSPYLRNRLESAFLAGLETGKVRMIRVIDDLLVSLAEE